MGLVRHLPENMSLPSIDFIDDLISLQSITSDLRQNYSPYKPIHAPSQNNADTNQAMKVVRQAFVNALAIRGWHEGCDDKINVAEQEEDCHW